MGARDLGLIRSLKAVADHGLRYQVIKLPLNNFFCLHLSRPTLMQEYTKNHTIPSNNRRNPDNTKHDWKLEPDNVRPDPGKVVLGGQPIGSTLQSTVSRPWEEANWSIEYLEGNRKTGP